MSFTSEKITFASNNDFEFGLGDKKRNCTYTIFNPLKNKGLVVYIPGFGDDLGEYSNVFSKKIAKRYNLSSMVVDYFCIHSRPAVGAEIIAEIEDVQEVNKIIIKKGRQPSGDWTKDLDLLAQLCAQTKHKVTLKTSIVPTKGEYQNFGLLPALDIFNAIRDAVKRYGLNQNNIILIGSSYGGYIANMVTKIAPGYIRAVMDNSSWAEPKLNYIAGRELNDPEYVVPVTAWVTLHSYVKSPWTLASGLPNSFTGQHYQIRNFDMGQLIQIANQGGRTTTYIFVHAENDTIASSKTKIAMAQNMVEINMIVKMTVYDKNDVDGVFVKNLDHGMSLSMLTFFERSYAELDTSPTSFTSKNVQVVRYRFDKCHYVFDLTTTPVTARMEYPA